jgi:hypothetical protein
MSTIFIKHKSLHLALYPPGGVLFATVSEGDLDSICICGLAFMMGDRILHPQGTPFTKANLTRSGFDISHFHSPSLDVTHVHDLQKEYCIPPQSLFFLWPGQA